MSVIIKGYNKTKRKIKLLVQESVNLLHQYNNFLTMYAFNKLFFKLFFNNKKSSVIFWKDNSQRNSNSYQRSMMLHEFEPYHWSTVRIL